MSRVAALFVAKDGCYFGLPDVDPWDEARDARLYDGPHPVVSHPPCERRGRYWGGAPTTWPRLIKGDDGGKFASALAAVRRWGGIIEHPEASGAWKAFRLNAPPRDGGWIAADWLDGHQGWTCCVEQGFYGHISRKATWLYAHGVELPDLRWGQGEQRLPEYAVERYGYEKARRIGVMAGLSSKDPRRAATPDEFRDLLLNIARTAILQSRETA